VAANNSPIIVVSGKPEIVVSTGNEINLVSHGTAAKISFESGEGKASIVYESGAQKHVLAEGGTLAIAEAFSSLASDLTQAGERRRLWRSFARHPRGIAGVLFASAILVAPVYLMSLSNKPAVTPSVPQLPSSGAASSIPDAAQIGQMIEELNQRRAKLTAEKPAKTSRARGEKAEATSETFKIPADLPPITEEHVEQKQSSVEPVQHGKALKATDDRTVEPKRDEPKQPAEDKASAQTNSSPVESTPKAVVGEDKGKASTAPKVDDKAVIAAMEEPLPRVNQDAINKAINKMVADGMTTDEAMKLLTMLQDIGSKGDQVTPDMLSGIPHEVAQILLDAGIIEKPGNKVDAPDGVPFRVIRLPENIMENHRGKDGIADIPERNSWASTGNFVSLPLPGGGDIKSPDAMKEFGLKP